MKKDDMWSMGVIMIKLYKRFEGVFNYQSFNSWFSQNIKINQLYAILSKYKIFINNQEYNINNNNINLKEIIRNNEYQKYNFRAELNLVGIIVQDSKELIRNLLEINPDKRFNAQ